MPGACSAKVVGARWRSRSRSRRRRDVVAPYWSGGERGAPIFAPRPLLLTRHKISPCR